jgi:hypothetical protein
MKETRRRLEIACKMDDHFKASALDDEDLWAPWDDIAAGDMTITAI